VTTMVARQSTPPAAGVLFVDDERNILLALRRLVMEEAFPVHLAGSGEEGLAILRTEPDIGLIISDQRMPGLCGAEFLARSREIAPEAVRIILTGYADMQAAIDAINKGGASRYIAKPWDDGEMLQVLREGRERYLLLRENRRLAELVRRQNEELKEWNDKLRSRVLQQTAALRQKNEALHVNHHRLQKNYRETIAAFSGLLELRAPDMRNHSRRVAQLAGGMARHSALPAKESETVHVAALLHDIGKIGIPDDSLGKDPALRTSLEEQEFRQHPVRSQVTIDAVEFLRAAGAVIRHHHEHFDGSGYPDGLRGAEIPLASRIIAMADFVANLKLGRYWSPEKVLSEVRPWLGRSLDPGLLPCLEKALRELEWGETTTAGMVEAPLCVGELREGMVLAGDLCSGTGLLLLSKGMRLNGASIAAIRRFQKIDPARGRIAVLVEKEP